MASLPREIAERYTIRAPVGEGAFSVTYLAIDAALQREVAIKVLREQYAAHEGLDSRFEREARSAARISHPNVISVYDYGRQGMLPYIVMQYVDGPNLKEYVREEGPLAIEEAINFAVQILDGLAAIHDEGIIHRDVKPQNVLIDDGLQAKITDFGVAFVTVDPGLTETGMAVGTAAYMAPEQASGEAVGPQADLYAVGVILYELLTGRLPFPGENPVQVMYRHVNEMPNPPRSINRAVPLAVEAVVLKALSKDAYDRFPDARTMRDALIDPGGAAAQTVVTRTVQPTPEYQSQQRPRVSSPTPAPRRRQAPPPPGRAVPARRQSNWTVVSLLLLVIVLAVVLFLLLMSDRFGGFGSGPDPTPTEQAGGVVDADPTEAAVSEETQEEEIVPEPSPTAVEPTPLPEDTPPPEPTPTEPEPTPEPTATEAEPEPTATEMEPEEPEEPEEQSQFNTPLEGRVLPPQWTSGKSISLTAEQFFGAGGVEPGEDIRFPGAVIDDRADVEFAALDDPSSYIGITIAAMTLDEQGEVPIRISLNGNVIWSGPAPFTSGEWTEIGWRVGNLGWLHEGVNIFTLEVLASSGAILVSNTTIYYG